MGWLFLKAVLVGAACLLPVVLGLVAVNLFIDAALQGKRWAVWMCVTVMIGFCALIGSAVLSAT